MFILDKESHREWALCSSRSHGTKFAMLESKLSTGISRTKRLHQDKFAFSLFWMSQCVACSPAWWILYHVTAICKGPIERFIIDYNAGRSAIDQRLSKTLFSLDPDNLQLHCYLGLGALFCCPFFCPLDQPCKTLQRCISLPGVHFIVPQVAQAQQACMLTFVMLQSRTVI